MMIRFQSAAALICCSSFMFTGGCEDSAAKQRDQVHESISRISQRLEVALASANAPAGDPRAELEQKLNKVLSDLNGIDGGEPGQEASKALLAATALRELADLHAAGAEAVEADHRQLRAVVRNKVAAAQELAAIAQGASQEDGQEERDSLMRQLQTAKTEVAALIAKHSELEGPISKHNSQNQISAAEVAKLRSEIGQLLSRAQELGHADGFDTYRQAKQVERQVDKLEYDMAQRDIELDYSLTPEHDAVGTRVSEMQGLIQSLETAHKQLEDFQAATAKEIEATRAAQKQLGEEIVTLLNQIQSETDDSVKGAYEQASAALEKAASQADSAARNLKGDDVHSARMISVRIREAQGRLHWAMARGLADHKHTLEQLVAASDALDSSANYNKLLGETSVAHDQAIQKATESYAAASEQLANVQSRGDSVALDTYRTNLERATNLLSGKDSASPGTDDAPAEDTSAGTRRTTDSDRGTVTGGAESPEALVAALKSIQSVDDMDVFFNLVDMTEAPEGMKAFINAMKSVLTSAKQLDQALQSKFGRSDEGFMAGLTAGGAQSMPKMGQVELVSVEGDTGTINNPDARGSKTILIKKVDDRWYISPDAMGTGVAGNAEQRQMADAMMKGMAQSFRSIGGILKTLAKDVQGGKYATFEDYQFDAAKKMQSASAGLMGGMMQNPGANRVNN